MGRSSWVACRGTAPREPIPAEDDLRLKRWQIDERLPHDETRLQGELVERVVRRQARPDRDETGEGKSNQAGGPAARS